MKTATFAISLFLIAAASSNVMAQHSHYSGRIDYVHYYGQQYSVEVVDASVNPHILRHTNNATGASHNDTRMDYVTWNGDWYSAEIHNGKFIHYPSGNRAKSHEDDHIDYVHGSGWRWRAWWDAGKKQFKHEPHYKDGEKKSLLKRIGSFVKQPRISIKIGSKFKFEASPERAEFKVLGFTAQTSQLQKRLSQIVGCVAEANAVSCALFVEGEVRRVLAGH